MAACLGASEGTLNDLCGVWRREGGCSEDTDHVERDRQKEEVSPTPLPRVLTARKSWQGNVAMYLGPVLVFEAGEDPQILYSG